MINALRPTTQWPALSATVIMLLAGCTQPTRRFEPSVDPRPLSDLQFIHYLEGVPLVTVEEGCRAMLIAADGRDDYDNHADRYAELSRRGVVRAAWKLEPRQVLDFGTMCYMMAQVGDLNPSINSTLLGSWGLGDRRYAARQVVAARIAPPLPTYRPVTGGEFIWALSHLDEVMAKKQMYTLEASDAR